MEGDEMSRHRLMSAFLAALAVGWAAAPTAAVAATPMTSITIGQLPPNSFDPTLVQGAGGFNIDNQLFAGLTAFDERTGQLTLDLAESYSASPDLMTWTFNLRPDAHWSDGRPVTAGDEVFGVQRSASPANSSNPYQAYLASLVASVTALGAHTVQFQLTRPAPYLPAFLTEPVAWPQPQRVVQAFGSAWTDPANIATSGGYTLASVSATA